MQEAENAWNLKIEGATVGSGNAVVASPRSNLLYVSTIEGNLIIVDPSDDTVQTFEASDLPNRSCRSGVALGVSTVEAEDEYAVYAVVDASNNPVSSSRVLAVSPDASEIWSVVVPGQVVGTPFVGLEGDVYVAHNEAIEGQEEASGRVSVIRNGEIIETIGVGDDLGPFAPPTGKIVDNSVLLVFGTSFENGRSNDGFLYMFVAERNTYEIRQASDNPLSGVAAPVVSADGTSVYLGQASGRVSGWTGNNDLQDVLNGRQGNVRPWSIRLNVPNNDATLPYSATPALSDDESVLYIAGGTSLIYSVDARDGRLRWVDVAPAPFSSSPIYSSSTEGDVVYFTSTDGTIRQYQAMTDTAQLNWEFECDDCAVEADMTLSPSNNLLYYITNDGTMNALRVANFVTESPTDMPSSMPTLVPSLSPSLSIFPTGNPSAVVTPNPTLPVTQDQTSGSSNIADQSDEGDDQDDGGDDQSDNDGNGDSGRGDLSGQVANSSSNLDGSIVAMIIVVIALALCACCCGLFFWRRHQDRQTEKKSRGMEREFDPEKGAVPSIDRRRMVSGSTAPIENTPPTHTSDTPNETIEPPQDATDIVEDEENDLSEYAYDDFSSVGYEASLGGNQANRSFFQRKKSSYSTNIEATKSISPPTSPVQLVKEKPPLSLTPIQLDTTLSPGQMSTASSATKKSTYSEAILSLFIPKVDDDEEPGQIRPTPPRPSPKQDPGDDSSVDESLFLEESVLAKDRDAPDDESAFAPSLPPTTFNTAREKPKLAPPERKQGYPSGPAKATRPGSYRGQGYPPDPAKATRPGSYHGSTGEKSRRPRAGLFSRRSGLSTQRADYAGAEDTTESSIPMSNPNLAEKPLISAEKSVVRNDKSSTDDVGTTSYISSTWNSFLTELSKAEDQFFNPSAVPPPPSTNPPPVPQSFEDDDSAGPVPGPPRKPPKTALL